MDSPPETQTVTAGAAVAAASGGAVTVTIAGNFWLTWSEVALEHARAANEARARAVAAPDGSSEMGEAFHDELKAGLVATTSAAFAVDAWYIEVKDRVALPTHVTDAWSKPGARPTRAAYVLETLKAGFALGAAASRWGRELKELYALRDGVVHFRSVAHEPQPHPTGKSNVSRQNVVYSAEAAVAAAELAVDVVSVCLTSARPELTGLKAWCDRAAHVPAMLAEMRERTLGVS